MQSIGKIGSLQGSVKAITPEGTERLLKSGDPVYLNERIVTSVGSAVGISLSNGAFLTLGESFDTVLDSKALHAGNDLLSPIGIEPVDLLQTDKVADEVAAMQKSLLAGNDPSVVLEAAAAGMGSSNAVDKGGNEGGDPVIRSYLTPEAIPDSGYVTVGPADGILPIISNFFSNLLPNFNPPPVAQPPVIVEPPPVAQPPVIVEPPPVAQPPVIVEPPPVAQPPVIVEPPPVAQPPVIVEPPPVAQPPVIVEPPPATHPPVIVEPPPVAQPPVIVEPPPVAQPPVIVEPPPVAQPPVIVEPPPVAHPPVIVEPPPVAQPPVIVEPPPVAQPPVCEPPPVVEPPVCEPLPVTEPPVIVEPPPATQPPVIVEPPPVVEPPVCEPPPVVEPPVCKPLPVVEPPPDHDKDHDRDQDKDHDKGHGNEKCQELDKGASHEKGSGQDKGVDIGKIIPALVVFDRPALTDDTKPAAIVKQPDDSKPSDMAKTDTVVVDEKPLNPSPIEQDHPAVASAAQSVDQPVGHEHHVPEKAAKAEGQNNGIAPVDSDKPLKGADNNGLIGHAHQEDDDGIKAPQHSIEKTDVLLPAGLDEKPDNIDRAAGDKHQGDTGDKATDKHSPTAHEPVDGEHNTHDLSYLVAEHEPLGSVGHTGDTKVDINQPKAEAASINLKDLLGDAEGDHLFHGDTSTPKPMATIAPTPVSMESCGIPPMDDFEHDLDHPV